MSQVIHTFTLPQSAIDKAPEWKPAATEMTAKWPKLPVKIGLVLLTADDELQASKIGKFDLMKGRYDQVKRAIRELDGKPASYAEGDTETFWGLCGPKIRTLLLSAYDQLAGATDEEESSFLKSEVAKVG